MTVYLQEKCHSTLFRKKRFEINFFFQRNASKFAIYIEKENPRSFFSFFIQSIFEFWSVGWIHQFAKYYTYALSLYSVKSKTSLFKKKRVYAPVKRSNFCHNFGDMKSQDFFNLFSFPANLHLTFSLMNSSLWSAGRKNQLDMFSKILVNFEVFIQTISSSINMLFLKSNHLDLHTLYIPLHKKNCIIRRQKRYAKLLNFV